MIWDREAYIKFFRIVTGYERPYDYQLDLAERIVESSKGIITLSAETGSGKTESVLVPALYKGTSCIIVEPYRAIVENLERRLKKYIGRLSKELSIPYRLGVDYGSFHIIYEARNGVVKERPAYSPFGVDILVTTVDEFIHRLLSAVGERKASVLAGIFHSSEPVVFFDEVHSYVSTEGYSLFTALMHTVASVAEYGLAVVSSATLPEVLKNHIKQSFIRYIDSIEAGKTRKEVYKDKKVLIKLSSSDVIREVLSNFADKPDLKLLVRVITPEEAYAVYQGLLESELTNIHIGVLHGRMALEDRREVLEAVEKLLESKERIILVATGVIEAGVDLDFTYCVTRLLPYPHLEQTLGRVNRKYDKENLIVIINSDNEVLKKVYSLPKGYAEELRKVLGEYEGTTTEWATLSSKLKLVDNGYSKASLDYKYLVDSYTSSFSKLLAVSYTSLFHLAGTPEEYVLGLMNSRYNIREAENIEYREEINGKTRTFRLPYWLLARLEKEDKDVRDCIKDHSLMRKTKETAKREKEAYGVIL